MWIRYELLICLETLGAPLEFGIKISEFNFVYWWVLLPEKWRSFPSCCPWYWRVSLFSSSPAGGDRARRCYTFNSRSTSTCEQRNMALFSSAARLCRLTGRTITSLSAKNKQCVDLPARRRYIFTSTGKSEWMFCKSLKETSVLSRSCSSEVSVGTQSMLISYCFHCLHGAAS